MEKNTKDRVIEVCKEHNTKSVFVTDDGHIFLPKAKNHAKNHAVSKGGKVREFNAEGEDITKAEKTAKSGTSIKPGTDSNPNRTKALKDHTTQELKKIVKDLAEEKGVDAIALNSKKMEIIAWIEQTRKAEAAAVDEGEKDNTPEDTPKKKAAAPKDEETK